jgi:hypothetical protein
VGIHPGLAAKLSCYGSAFALTVWLAFSLLAMGF